MAACGSADAGEGGVGEVVRRGEIWLVSFGDEPRGSEPAFDRPAVVVQDDILNESVMGTVMVAPVTSNLRRAMALGSVRLEAATSGLDRESVVLTCQLMTVDKSALGERVGSLSRRQLKMLDRGLTLALGLVP